jgi:hypothetical protein
MSTKMTRQHFQFIADIISRMPDVNAGYVVTRESVALAFARELHRTNSQFRESTFMEACKVELC